MATTDAFYDLLFYSLVDRNWMIREDCAKLISDVHFEVISRTCCVKWKSLPPHLEMEPTIAEDIDKLHCTEREKCHQFLKKWKAVKDQKATYEELVLALIKIGCMEDAEKVIKLLKVTLFPPQPGKRVWIPEFSVGDTVIPAHYSDHPPPISSTLTEYGPSYSFCDDSGEQMTRKEISEEATSVQKGAENAIKKLIPTPQAGGKISAQYSDELLELATPSEQRGRRFHPYHFGGTTVPTTSSGEQLLQRPPPRQNTGQAIPSSTPGANSSSEMDAVSDQSLDINDLADVFDMVGPLSAQWRLLVTQLGLKECTLDIIEKNNPGDVKLCLMKALGDWLKLNYDYQKRGRPSWRRLAQAVHSLDNGLFEKLAQTYSSIN